MVHVSNILWNFYGFIGRVNWSFVHIHGQQTGLPVGWQLEAGNTCHYRSVRLLSNPHPTPHHDGVGALAVSKYLTFLWRCLEFSNFGGAITVFNFNIEARQVGQGAIFDACIIWNIIKNEIFTRLFLCHSYLINWFSSSRWLFSGLWQMHVIFSSSGLFPTGTARPLLQQSTMRTSPMAPAEERQLGVKAPGAQWHGVGGAMPRDGQEFEGLKWKPIYTVWLWC